MKCVFNEKETHQLPWNKCSFSCKCQQALIDFSDIQPFADKSIILCAIKWNYMKWFDQKAWQRECFPIWSWVSRLECLNDVASLTWLVIQGAFCVSMRYFAAKLVASPECFCYIERRLSLNQYAVVCLWCRLIEGYMVCKLILFAVIWVHHLKRRDFVFIWRDVDEILTTVKHQLKIRVEKETFLQQRVGVCSMTVM